MFEMFTMNVKKEITKSELLHEIKKEEWRKTISEEDYNKNIERIREIHHDTLQKISRENEMSKYRKCRAKPRPLSSTVSESTQNAYDKWKKENLNTEIPEVWVKNLLLIVHCISKPDPGPDDEETISGCLKAQCLDYGVFWDSPAYILKSLRRCVLTRDWNNLTSLLLILLNYDKKYLCVIKNMCKFILKCNPLITDEALDRFKHLIEEGTEEITIV